MFRKTSVSRRDPFISWMNVLQRARASSFGVAAPGEGTVIGC
jgi:hypothetical protein